MSILYSILCIASLVRDTHTLLPGHSSSGATGVCYPAHVGQVIQSLILGDYSRGGPFAIEALCYYFLVEHARRRDADARNWSLCGLILRLALQNGYHREPSLFPNITPFEGELRRRVWMMLHYLDAVLAIQMGLPRLIKDEQCDTQPPHNLLDTDFDEDTARLPNPRPDNEVTPIRWWLARSKIMTIVIQIADRRLVRTAALEGEEHVCSCAGVSQMDALLRDTYESLPQSMKFTSLVHCLDNCPEDIAKQLVTSISFQKGLIMLHHRHAWGEISSSSSSACEQDGCSATCAGRSSTRPCIEAALQMLEYQDLVYSESQPGGALAELGWRVLSSPLAHEFLMATSVLCAYMDLIYKGDPPDTAEPLADLTDVVQRALLRTYDIWSSQRNTSKDAERATDTLRILVGKLQDRDSNSDSARGGTQPNGMFNTPPSELQFADLGAMLQDSFGLYGEGMNDFSGFFAW